MNRTIIILQCSVLIWTKRPRNRNDKAATIFHFVAKVSALNSSSVNEKKEWVSLWDDKFTMWMKHVKISDLLPAAWQLCQKFWYTIFTKGFCFMYRYKRFVCVCVCVCVWYCNALSNRGPINFFFEELKYYTHTHEASDPVGLMNWARISAWIIYDTLKWNVLPILN